MAGNSIKGLLVAAAVSVGLTSAAVAQSAAKQPAWWPIMRQCGAYAEEHAPPHTADPASWEWLAKCTARNYLAAVPAAAVQGCIAATDAANQPFIPGARPDIGVKGVIDCLEAHGAPRVRN